MNLSLKLEPVLGCDLDAAVRDGWRIAQQLGLHHVSFEANGMHYVCYPDGTAQRWPIVQPEPPYGRDIRRFGQDWEHIPPIVEVKA